MVGSGSTPMPKNRARVGNRPSSARSLLNPGPLRAAVIFKGTAVLARRQTGFARKPQEWRCGDQEMRRRQGMTWSTSPAGMQKMLAAQPAGHDRKVHLRWLWVAPGGHAWPGDHAFGSCALGKNSCSPLIL